ncbi:MAG TPA: molybdopterin-dependent oxidoreductase [Gemmatimonadales bacterium]|nr:molybdopterin-dependent oxidoreductase [Gemmatimonadales bacterium]
MADRRLDRRDFLRLGLVAGPASLVAACGWDGGPLIQPRLSAISRFNDWVGEHVLMSSSRLARTYPASARSGTMPSYFVSDTTPLLPDPARWSLEVGGLVRKPTSFTRTMLEALPSVSYTVKHHCVEGWTAISSWAGVPVATVAALVEPLPAARYLKFESFDENYYNGWDLKSAMHPQTILAYAHNDQPLRPDHGAPLRVYSPIKLGYKMTKYLTRMTFTAERPGGYWEDQGYPWLGGL